MASLTGSMPANNNKPPSNPIPAAKRTQLGSDSDNEVITIDSDDNADVDGTKCTERVKTEFKQAAGRGGNGSDKSVVKKARQQGTADAIVISDSDEEPAGKGRMGWKSKSLYPETTINTNR